jgi:hypothetical protein
VPSELPEISDSAHRRGGIPERGDLVVWCGRAAGRALLYFIQHKVDLGQGEAGQLQVEIHLEEPLQFDGQQLAVPAGIERELVVGDDIGPAFGRIEMREA